MLSDREGGDFTSWQFAESSRQQGGFQGLARSDLPERHSVGIANDVGQNGIRDEKSLGRQTDEFRRNFNHTNLLMPCNGPGKGFDGVSAEALGEPAAIRAGPQAKREHERLGHEFPAAEPFGKFNRLPRPSGGIAGKIAAIPLPNAIDIAYGRRT